MMVGHAGYYGCFVCEIEGERVDHRTVFPQTNTAKWRERDQDDIKKCSEKACFSSKYNHFSSSYDYSSPKNDPKLSEISRYS